jgi:hypothetical protein
MPKEKPRKALPDWTKRSPDVVTVNPGPSTKKNFVHNAPKPQHNFTKKSATVDKATQFRRNWALDIIRGKVK